MIEAKTPLTSTFEYLLAEDSAVDRAHPDYAPSAYAEDLDPRHLPLRAGERATRFVCRPLSRQALTKVLRLAGPSMENELEALQLAVAYGLRSVIDGPPDLALTFDADGERLDPKSLDAMHQRLGYGIFTRVGGAVVKRSVLSPF